MTPKISARIKCGHPNGGTKCRRGRLNAGAVAINWQISTQTVVNSVPLQQMCLIVFSALTRCWLGYLSGARCK